MIRDPSDGTVRDEPTAPAAQNRPRDAAPPVSGLPEGSTKPENRVRLEKSREWLKDYHKSKGGVE